MNQYQIRELLKQNAPKIFASVNAHSPLPSQTKIAEIINQPGDQLPSSKDHVDQEPMLNTTTDRRK